MLRSAVHVVDPDPGLPNIGWMVAPEIFCSDNGSPPDAHPVAAGAYLSYLESQGSPRFGLPSAFWRLVKGLPITQMLYPC